jgi:hypothetical protein
LGVGGISGGFSKAEQSKNLVCGGKYRQVLGIAQLNGERKRERDRERERERFPW